MWPPCTNAIDFPCCVDQPNVHQLDGGGKGREQERAPREGLGLAEGGDLHVDVVAHPRVGRQRRGGAHGGHVAYADRVGVHGEVEAIHHVRQHARTLADHMPEDADTNGLAANILQQVKTGKRATQQRVHLVAHPDVEELAGVHASRKIRCIEVELEIAVPEIRTARDGHIMEEFCALGHGRTMRRPTPARNVWIAR